MTSTFEVRQATVVDHRAILQVAKQSPYTRDFSNRIFSGPALYARGWIRVLARSGQKEHQGVGWPDIVGFTCVRHKVRAPETVLYFIGVDREHHRMGIGEILLADLINESPHRRIALNVMKSNEQARSFYRKHRFRGDGDALEGAGVRLVLEW